MSASPPAVYPATAGTSEVVRALVKKPLIFSFVRSDFQFQENIATLGRRTDGDPGLWPFYLLCCAWNSGDDGFVVLRGTTHSPPRNAGRVL